MAESKGPRVLVPEELLDELTGSAAEGAGPESADAGPGPDPDPGAAGADDDPLVRLQKELEETRDRYLRLAADFDNYKRRTLKERQDLHNYANEGLIKELLTTLDNLERAAEHGRKDESGGDVASLMEGVDLTHRSLMQLLEKSDVRVVDPEGQRFDPQVHEAMRQIPTSERAAGLVVEVYQKGYLLKDRLLRPALVAVSSRPLEDAGPQAQSEMETQTGSSDTDTDTDTDTE